DLHFPPFRDAIRTGGARSVMAAYNSVNGRPASASARLLTTTLREDWRFDGVVIADQGGVGGANVLHHTAAGYADATAQALRAGLDVVFQSSAADAALFWPAFRDGLVPSAAVDSAVVRVLRLKFALGLFDRPYVGSDTASAERDDSAHVLARRAAESSIVLLANRRHALPLSRIARVAVIGPAATASPVGGYSVAPVRGRPLVDEIAARLGGSEAVRVAAGPWPTAAEWAVVPMRALSHDAGTAPARGLRGAYFANPWLTGEPATVRADSTVDFSWTFNGPARGVGTDWYSVRWVGVLDVPARGARLAVEGDDGVRLWVDGRPVIDGDRKVSYTRRVASRTLGAGRHELRLEYRQTTGNGRVRLLWDVVEPSGPSEEQRIADAVLAARGVDAAIITVTVDEGEFRDRSSLRLPGRQEELIRRVAATGAPTIVVIYAGGAVITEPWDAHVDAVLQAFYPGEAGAAALVRLLFGDVSPSARLPYTVPRHEGQLPLVYDHLPTGRGDDYVDLTGRPLYPFGFGLSYTEFGYRDLVVVPARVGATDTATVTFKVRNTGPRAGDEIAQLYIRHTIAPTAQPVLALRGFARVPLAPGEERLVTLRLPAEALAVRHTDGRKALTADSVVLFVGASSRDIRLRGVLQTRGGER
ncbi:MAG: beta-glucosidase, partial [Planctomycetes bacterium]|nr:beta-glucosidase [Planctomycetota bacterium]